MITLNIRYVYHDGRGYLPRVDVDTLATYGLLKALAGKGQP